MAKEGSWLARAMPLLLWLPAYQRKWLGSDIFAGFAVWAILVPQAVAYAQIAGMPAQAALFAAPVALLAYAFFGTSRQIVVGVTSSIAITSAATVGALAGGNNVQYITLTIELALLAGLLFLLFGVARLGFIADFLARPVITGFLFGLSLVITIGQLPKLFGVAAGQGNFFQKAWDLLTHLGQSNGWAILIGVISLLMLFVLQRFAPKLPAYLIVMILGIGLVTVFGLERDGVVVTGTIPGGFPVPKIPTIRLDDLVNLFPGALGILFVAFAEHISAARGFALDHHYEIDANKELTALGVANLATGLFQGFALGGGMSQSTVNDQAGGRSQISGIVAAGLLLITVLALTPLFYNLPQATLGAVVIYAVSHAWKVGELKRYFHLRRIDFVLALTALLGELCLNVLPGLLLAVVLSLLILVYNASRPHLARLGKAPGQRSYSDVERHPESETVPGLLILRLDAPMFFANNTLMVEQIKQRVRTTEPAVHAVVLDMEMSERLDVSSLDTLSELVTDLQAQDVTLWLANVRGPIRDMLRQSGADKLIGEAHIYASIEEAVETFTGDDTKEKV